MVFLYFSLSNSFFWETQRFWATTNLPILVVLFEVKYPLNYHDYSITSNTSLLITLLKALLLIAKKSQYHMYVQDRYYVFSSLTVPSPHSAQATGRGKCLVALTSAERSFTVGIPDIRCFLRSLMFIFSWALLHTLTDMMGTLQSFLTRTATVPTIWMKWRQDELSRS